MSDVVDNRVVEMQFDNADFEKNVAESMKTLRALQKSLDSLSDAADGFKSLSEAANKVDFSKLNDNIDAIAHRMSAWGIASAKIVTDFTSFAEKKLIGLAKKTIGQIESGGKRRASNIEKAKFQLRGLGVEWARIEGDINYGVQDTAYGLDAAAKVASQLVASSVKIGDEMKTSLRGISGVASMTQSSYEEIGHIFTTIAGQGKMMTMQLRQLEMRGLNVAAEMARMANSILNGEIKDLDESTIKLVKDFTNGTKLTESAIREMVTDGKINFKIFSTLMDEAFGEHAKDANRTFEGVVANINAALSKIGALFYGPFLEDSSALIIFLDRIRGDLNDLKKFISPVVETITDALIGAIYKIDMFYKSLRLIGVWKTLWEAFTLVVYGVLDVIKPLKEGFASVFEGLNFADLLLKASEKLRDFAERLWITEKAADGLRAIGKLLGNVLKVIGKLLTSILRVLTPVINAVGAILEFVLEITGIFEPVVSIIGRLIYEFLRFKLLKDVISILKSFSSVLVNALKTVGRIVGITFVGAILAAIKVISTFIEMLSSFVGVIKEAVAYNIRLLSPLVKIAYQFVRFRLLKDVVLILKSFITTLKNAFVIISGAASKAFISMSQKILDTISKIILKAKEFSTNLKSSFGDIHGLIGLFINPLVNAIERVKSAFMPTRGGKGIFGTFIDDVKEILGLQTASIPEKIGKISEKIGILAQSFMTFAKTKFSTISLGFKDFISNVGEVGFVKAISDKFTVLKDNVKNTSIFKNFSSIINDLSTKTIPVLITNLKSLISLNISNFSKSIKTLGSNLKSFYNQLKQNEKIAAILNKIEGVVAKVHAKIAPFIPTLKTLGYVIAGIGLTAFNELQEVLQKLSKLTFEDIKNGFTSITTSFKNIIETVKNLPIVGKTIGVLQGVFTSLVGLFGKIVPYFKSLGDVFTKFVGLFRHGSKDVKRSSTTVKRSLETFDDTSGNKGPFSGLTSAIQFLKDRFTDLVDFIKREFPGLNLQKVLVAAFALTTAKSLISLANALTSTTKQVQEVVKQFGEVEKAATGLFTGFKAIPESITTALDAWKKRMLKPTYSIGEQVKMLAISVAILAGSLWLIAQIPEADLERSIKYLGVLAAGVLAFAVVLTMISEVKLNEAMAKFSLSIFLMASSLLVLVGALKLALTINESIKNIAKGIGVLAGLSAVLIAIAAAMAKFVPSLTSGALFFIAIAAAVWILARAFIGLVDLIDKNADRVNNAINYIGSMMVALSLFTYTVSKISFASGLSVLALVLSIKLIGSALTSIAEDTPDFKTLWDNIDKYGVALTAIGALLVATRVAGEHAKSAGLGILAMAIAMRIIVYNIVVITEYLNQAIAEGKSTGIAAGIVYFILIMGALIGLIIASQKAGEHAKSAMKGIISLAIGMSLLMFAISHITKSLIEADPSGQMAFAAMGMLVVVTILSGLLIAATSLTKDAKIGPIIALGLILAELAVVLMLLSVIPVEDIIPATIALGAIMLALGYVLKQASKLSAFTNTKPLIAAIAALVLAVVALTVLNDMDMVKTLASSFSLSLIIVSIGKCVALASKTDWKGTKLLLAGIILLAGAAAALWLLSEYPWQQILAAGVALSGVIFVLSTCLTSSRWLGTEGTKVAGSLVIAAAALIGFGIALSILAQNPWQQILAAALGMSAVIAVLTIVIATIGNMGKEAAIGAGVLLLAVVPLFLVAKVMSQLAELDWEQVRENMKTMGAAFLALIVAIGIIGSVAMTGFGAGAIALGLAAIGAAILEFALAGAVFVAVASGIAYAINAVAEALKNFASISPEQVDNMKNAIIGFGAAIGAGFASIFGEFIMTLASYWDQLTQWVFGTVIPGASQMGASIIGAIITGVKSAIPALGSVLGGIVKYVLPLLAGPGVYEGVKSAGNLFSDGYSSGIQEGSEGVYKAVDDLGNGSVDELKKSIDSHSPSKATKSIGNDFGSGYESGIGESADGVNKAVKKLGDGSLESLRKSIDAHSASEFTKLIGNDFGSGYGTGISEMNDLASQAGFDLGDFSLGGLGKIVASGAFEALGESAAGRFIKSLVGKANAALKDKGIDFDSLLGDVKDSAITTFESIAGGIAGGSGRSLKKKDPLDYHAWSKQAREYNKGEQDTYTGINRKTEEEILEPEKEGPGGGGGGGGASAETKKSTEIMDYARKVVEKYNEAFGNLYKTAGDTSSLEASKAAVTELAKAMYEAQGNVLDGTDEKLAEALEAFKTFSDNMKKSMKETLKSTEEFKESFDFKPKDLMKNMDSNKKALDKWWKYLELAGMKGFDKNYLLNITNAGFSVESLNKLRYMCSLHSDAVDEYNKRIQEADNDTEESFNSHMSRLLAIFENAAGKLSADNSFTSALKEKFNDWRTIIAGYMLNYDEIVQRAEEGYKSSLQHFKKFTVSKEDREITIDSLIENEKSQKKAQEMFTQHLKGIIDKGGSQELIDHIMSMGYEQGYAYAKAIDDGTEEQIKELGGLFHATEYESPKENAEDLGHSYAAAYTEGFKEMFDEMGNYLQEVANGEHFGFIPEDLSNIMLEVAKAICGDEETARTALGYFNTNLETMFNTLVTDDQAAGMVSNYAGTLASSFANGFNSKEATDALATATDGVTSTVTDAFLASLESNEGSLEKIEEIGSIVPFSFENGIVKNIKLPEDAAKTLSEGIVDTSEGIITLEKFRDISNNIIEGLKQGLYDGKDDVLGAIRDLCSDMADTMQEETEIESPSKLFARFGRFIDLGLAQGISQNADIAIDETASLAQRTVDSFNSVVGMINNILADNMDYNPSIVPVLDTTMLQNGMGYMNGLFDTGYGIGIGGQYADAVSASFANKETPEDSQQNPGNTYNFTQNNYSPKALSRLDIYRQTKNQFTRMKGVVEAR